MDDFEKAFFDYLELCKEELIETANKKKLDRKEAETLFAEFITERKSSFDYRDKNYKLLLLGSALTNYEEALNANNHTKKIVHLLRGYAAFAHLAGNSTFLDFASMHGRQNVAKKLDNDPKHQSMEKIKQEYKKRWDSGSRFPHGRLAEFYKEMANKEFDDKDGKKFSLDLFAIKNAIEIYRKELGHTKKLKAI